MWFNDKIREYSDITYTINKQFCINNNIDILKSSKLNEPNRKPHWERFQLVLNILNKNIYDYVIWIGKPYLY